MLSADRLCIEIKLPAEFYFGACERIGFDATHVTFTGIRAQWQLHLQLVVIGGIFRSFPCLLQHRYAAAGNA